MKIDPLLIFDVTLLINLTQPGLVVQIGLSPFPEIMFMYFLYFPVCRFSRISLETPFPRYQMSWRRRSTNKETTSSGRGLGETRSSSYPRDRLVELRCIAPEPDHIPIQTCVSRGLRDS